MNAGQWSSRRRVSASCEMSVSTKDSLIWHYIRCSIRIFISLIDLFDVHSATIMKLAWHPGPGDERKRVGNFPECMLVGTRFRFQVDRIIRTVFRFPTAAAHGNNRLLHRCSKVACNRGEISGDRLRGEAKMNIISVRFSTRWVGW
jgi:hypothetical protein